MKKTLQEKEGFTLLITIIGLALMTTLGFAILTSTTNNFKATDTDSKNQSAYYIAEAGINYAIDNINTLMNSTNDVNSTAFFSSLNTKIDALPRTIYFDENFGVVTSANITISQKPDNKDTKVYSIESIGVIGESKRTVSSTISITWSSIKDSVLDDTFKQVALYAEEFKFKGSILSAPNKTIVLTSPEKKFAREGSVIDAKNIYFSGLDKGILSGQTIGTMNSKSNVFIKNNVLDTDNIFLVYGDVQSDSDFSVKKMITIKGDLQVKGNLDLHASGTEITGDVYVGGNFSLGNAKVLGNVYVMGNFKADGDGYIRGNAFVKGNLEMNIPEWKLVFENGVKYSGSLSFSKIKQNESYIHLKTLEHKDIIKQLVERNLDITLPLKCKIQFKDKNENSNWYTNNGYKLVDGNSIPGIKSEKKIIVNDFFSSEDWNYDLKDAVIIGSDDIEVSKLTNFMGVIISLNGDIEFKGEGEFTGVMIADEEISFTKDGSKATLQSLEEYFKNDISKIPVDYSNDCYRPILVPGGGAPGSNTPGKTNSVIKIEKNIKEQ